MVGLRVQGVFLVHLPQTRCLSLKITWYIFPLLPLRLVPIEKCWAGSSGCDFKCLERLAEPPYNLPYGAGEGPNCRLRVQGVFLVHLPQTRCLPLKITWYIFPLLPLRLVPIEKC